MKVDRPRSRGFTLVELLIAGLVSIIVLVGVLTASGAQTRSYAVGSRQTLAQAYGRGALLYMEQHLAWAGYGIDPVLAFDFDRYTTGPCPAEMSPCPRDTRTNADELVFYARNPRYWVPGAGNVAGPTGGPAEPAGNAWTIRGGGLGPTATTMTIGARQGDSFSRGQIVLAVCRGGHFYTFATIAQNVAPLGNPQDYTLTLAAASASDPLNRPDLAVSPAAGAACFAAGDARLFLVDRYRFHVRPETAGNNVIPYLVLDQGIDRNRDGTIDADDELVIAEGVEDLQVAYVLANPLLPTPVVGESGAIVAVRAGAGEYGSSGSSNQITTTLFPGNPPAAGETVYAPSSFYTYRVGPPASAQRLTDHQANIVGVRMAVVTRSPGSDTETRGDLFLPLNQTAQPAWIVDRQVAGRDGYQRALFESTVRLPNMTSAGMLYF